MKSVPSPSRGGGAILCLESDLLQVQAARYSAFRHSTRFRDRPGGPSLRSFQFRTGACVPIKWSPSPREGEGGRRSR